MGNIRVELNRADDLANATAIGFGMKLACDQIPPTELRATVFR